MRRAGILGKSTEKEPKLCIALKDLLAQTMPDRIAIASGEADSSGNFQLQSGTILSPLATLSLQLATDLHRQTGKPAKRG